jgi:POT family proton-dependent oligopeptide transporter
VTASSASDSSPAPKRKGPIEDLKDTLAALKAVKPGFWTCLLVFMLDGAAYFGVLNILTLHLSKAIGLDDARAGQFVAIFLTGAVTILAAVFGFLVDRWGVKKTMIITIAVALAGRSLLALAPSLPFAAPISAVALLMMAFAAGLLQSAVYGGVKLATDERSASVGFSLVYAMMNAGVILESMVSSPVRAAYGTTGVMWMCAAITLTYLVLALRFPDSTGGPVAPGADAKEPLMTRIKGMLDARFLFFIFVLLGVRTLFAHQWLTMPHYVTRAYPAEVGEKFEWINALNPLIIVIGTPLVAAFTRHVHVVTMMLLGTLVSASATFLLVPGPNLTALLLYVTIFSIGEALWSSRFYEYVADLAPPDKVGIYMGWASIPWFLAKTTTGMYSGVMLKAYCPEGGPFDTGTMWLIYAVIGMTSPVGLLLAMKWLKAGVHHKPAAA